MIPWLLFGVLLVITLTYAYVLVTYCKHAQHCLIVVRAGHTPPSLPPPTYRDMAGTPWIKANANIDIHSALRYHRLMEYRDIESILAQLHGVPQDDRGKLRSRLRFLRDQGVPAVEKPGKGARVDYRFPDLWEMHLALLLQRFGLPPAHVKVVLEERLNLLSWHDKMREQEEQEKREREKQTTGSPPPDIWVHMRYFSKNLEDGSPAPVTLIAPFDEIVRAIERLDKEQQTAIIGLINLSKLTRECESAILKHVQ
jgi:hypothetical protein